MSFVCLMRDESGNFSRGVDIDQCPDFYNDADDDAQRRLHVLVTQPETGEVALVDRTDGTVVDFERSQPGFSFMPVGADPGAIVSTPGGLASFVAVSEPGREGIFALPSSCVGPRPDSGAIRDIRTWPACNLPVAPGPMQLLDDPAVDHDGNPDTPAQVRATCQDPYVETASLVGNAPAASRDSCPADLATEERGGRRKLAVALPALGEVWVLDAQSLLDREPGRFDACEPERRVSLGATVEALDQVIPDDLATSDPTCRPSARPPAAAAQTAAPWPVDFALDDAGRLFVADSQVPLVHVLDASRPCELAQLPPLHPVSFAEPGATITTRRLAVSERTRDGKRFVYAVDDSATSSAGTLMVFDVSSDSRERTPIVRPRAAFNPGEPPDRIDLGRPVADVEFVTQDFPRSDPDTGALVEGVACEPHPIDFPRESLEAQYRSSDDASVGARPALMRGTFAFAALLSGQIVVIDVEDLDASCRRPATHNPGSQEDIYGCRLDDPSLPPEGYVDAEGFTVSNELSCNLVVPHRTRSGSTFANSGALRTIALRAFPTLTLDTGRSAATDQTDDGRDQPKMLAARHRANVEDLLFVGALAYGTENATNRLDVDPAIAERSSLLLNYREPRAYLGSEEFTATYEGIVRSTGRAQVAVDATSGLGRINEGINADFCGAGVQDTDVTREIGREMGVDEADLDAFALRHADYAQLTGSLLDEDDGYWTDRPGSECGLELFESETAEESSRLIGRPLCDQFFGPPESPSQWRDLRIVKAHEDFLEVESRDFDPTRNSASRRRALVDFVACCFPGSIPFQVRASRQWVVRGTASGLPHGIKADPSTHRCVRDCSPLVEHQRGRAFELSCSENCPRDSRGRPSVGLATPGEDFACIVDDADNGIDPGEPGSECIFQSLTTRFALYRGLQPSLRDMRFRWQLGDGFEPLTRSLTNTTTTVSTPRSLTLSPTHFEFGITDGTASGLTLLSPRSLLATSVF